MSNVSNKFNNLSPEQLIPALYKTGGPAEGDGSFFCFVYCVVLSGASRSNFLYTQTCKNTSVLTTE